MNTYSYTIDQIKDAQQEFEQRYDNYLHHKSSSNNARMPSLFEILEQSKDRLENPISMKDMLKRASRAPT